MLRRYGVMRDPRLALRVLASEGAVGAGQLLRDHTGAGIKGRVRGFLSGGGLEPRSAAGAPLLDIGTSEAIALRRRRRA
jgi:hypothetical protein